MGILTRKQGESYVIASDREGDNPPAKRAPKRLSDIYQVWTGDAWSIDMDDAKLFETLDDADDYVRANYAQVSRQV